MSSFSEQDPIDPDDPELDYTRLRLRDRLAKLGPCVSQGARSEPIRSPPILRPAPPRPSQGDVESKPAPRQSVAASTPSDITGSTSTAPAQPSQGDVESKPALAEFKALLASPPSQPATHEQSQQLLQRFLQWRSKY